MVRAGTGSMVCSRRKVIANVEVENACITALPSTSTKWLVLLDPRSAQDVSDDISDDISAEEEVVAVIVTKERN